MPSEQNQIAAIGFLYVVAVAVVTFWAAYRWGESQRKSDRRLRHERNAALIAQAARMDVEFNRAHIKRCFMSASAIKDAR